MFYTLSLYNVNVNYISKLEKNKNKWEKSLEWIPVSRVCGIQKQDSRAKNVTGRIRDVRVWHHGSQRKILLKDGTKWELKSIYIDKEVTDDPREQV